MEIMGPWCHWGRKYSSFDSNLPARRNPHFTVKHFAWALSSILEILLSSELRIIVAVVSSTQVIQLCQNIEYQRNIFKFLCWGLQILWPRALSFRKEPQCCLLFSGDLSIGIETKLVVNNYCINLIIVVKSMTTMIPNINWILTNPRNPSWTALTRTNKSVIVVKTIRPSTYQPIVILTTNFFPMEAAVQQHLNRTMG